VGPEILLAIQAWKAAYSGIQYCCEALREGTVQIKAAKGEIENTVESAKALYTEVTGLWGWFKNLLGSPKPAKPETQAVPEPSKKAEPAKKSAKKATYVPTPEDVVQEFIGHLGEWFDKYSMLKQFAEKRYAEVFSKDVIDQKEVLELAQLQAELDSAYPQLSSLMADAPWQIGPIWSQFKAMQDKVAAGQAARQLRQRREKARQDAIAFEKRNDKIDRQMTIFWSLVLVWFFWMMMGAIWLNMRTTQ
jgi:hypothetical protein